jgi:hypothetical protein
VVGMMRGEAVEDVPDGEVGDVYLT